MFLLTLKNHTWCHMGEDLRPIDADPIKSRMREFVTNKYVRIIL
jgi:hypothetical protein